MGGCPEGPGGRGGKTSRVAARSEGSETSGGSEASCEKGRRAQGEAGSCPEKCGAAEATTRPGQASGREAVGGGVGADPQGRPSPATGSRRAACGCGVAAPRPDPRFGECDESNAKPVS